MLMPRRKSYGVGTLSTIRDGGARIEAEGVRGAAVRPATGLQRLAELQRRRQGSPPTDAMPGSGRRMAADFLVTKPWRGLPDATNSLGHRQRPTGEPRLADRQFAGAGQCRIGGRPVFGRAGQRSWNQPARSPSGVADGSVMCASD